MCLAPKVSICIPTYNRERYLQGTLTGEFAQTHDDHKGVVVDDNSTDNTAQIVKDAAHDIRCR